MTHPSVARLLMPALRWRDDGGFAHEASRIDAALALGVGGFILFGGRAAAVQLLVADLLRRAGRPLLIASDLERGAGQQFEGLVEVPPPAALASLGDLDVIRWAGACTARAARAVGINWVFAPVADLDLLADNPIVQTRSFGADPQAVAAALVAWIDGCEAEQVLACAKHFPGHGRTRRDSHLEEPLVETTFEELAATDLVPFRAAIEARVGSIMTAHVAYPGLDATGTPATLSPPILAHLRDALGFDGLVVSDALNMAGAQRGRSEAEAALAALAAGCDVLLYPDDPHAVVALLERAVADGRLAEARVAEAVARVERALAWTALPRLSPKVPDADLAAQTAMALLRMLRGDEPVLRLPLSLQIIDDDLGGPYPPMPASDRLARALNAAGVPMGPGGSVVRCLFSEPRAWKGRAGLGAAAAGALATAAPADLVVLFAHPRLLAAVPDATPVLHAWHRQTLMQETVAAWLASQAHAR